MNILVTGGAGYLGAELIKHLNANGDVEKVYIYDNLTRPGVNFFFGEVVLEKVEFIQGDILDSYAMEKALKKVDKVYHLAAYVSFPYNYTQNVQYEQVNHWGTLNLVRSIERVDHHIDQLIYMSSTSVYGLKDGIQIDDAPAPTNAYGRSKYEGEKCVELLKDQMEVNILRSGNVFGYNRCLRKDSVINEFIFNGWIEGKILIYGDGSQQRAFMSLPRLATQLANYMSEGTKEAMNVAIDFNASINDLRDWLITEQLPDLEYTYVNQNIEYEGQSFEGMPHITEQYELLNTAFEEFTSQMVIAS